MYSFGRHPKATLVTIVDQICKLTRLRQQLGSITQSHVLEASSLRENFTES